MIENLNGGEDEFEGPGLELRQHVREVEDLVGREEGRLFARQEELRFLLGDELEILRTNDPALYGSISQAAGLEKPVEDAQQLVDAHLTAPEDSPLRQHLISKLSDEGTAVDLVQLIREMEALVATL